MIGSIQRMIRHFAYWFILLGVLLFIFAHSGMAAGLIVLSVYLLSTFILGVVGYIGLRRSLKVVIRPERAGYIYGFTDIGQVIPLVKIGRETEKGSRLKSHKTAAPFGLWVFFDIYVGDTVLAEGILHDHYKMHRVKKNNEWFYIATPVMFFEMMLIRVFGVTR